MSAWSKILTKIKFINPYIFFPPWRLFNEFRENGGILLGFYSVFFCSFVTLANIQKPIVVIIPSYNNAAWCIKNMESILIQKYENYRVIFIDDCSTDDTCEKVKNKIVELNATARVKVIHNASRHGALANIYTAVHSCKNDEIIALVDGDDWLAHEGVLETINNAYQDPNIWMTYGQFKVHPDNRIGECKDIPKGISRGNYYREYDWCTSHLRTFYAGLFKHIKLQDLIYKGNFFEVTWDMAMLFPMLEMSGGRFVCIKDVLYIYNCANESNDFKTKLLLQIHCNKLISSKKKYSSLNSIDLSSQKLPTVSLLMMSNDNPQALHDFLESITRYSSGLAEIRVVYSASTDRMKEHYATIKKHFASCAVYDQCTQADFKAITLKHLQASKEYIVLAHDGVMLKDTVQFDVCAQALRNTHAQGFYFNLGKNNISHKLLERAQEQPTFIPLDSNLYAWQFEEGEYAWRTPFTCNMAMYKTDAIALLCAQACYDSLQSLEQAFLMARVDLRAIGLMHKESPLRQGSGGQAS